MKNHLVIVESPNKTVSIKNYLGPGYNVVASYGHFRDLPIKSMGVAPPDFKLDYEIAEKAKKTKVVQKMREAYKGCDLVYIATDGDREGEAIGWHIKDLLNIPDEKIRRVVFSEITKKEIEKSMQSPGKIDMQVVYAQEGRRAMDRLIGYTVSPVISNLSGRRLSAGRVQSIGLKLVVERCIEIENFKSTNHFGVSLYLQNDEQFIRARLNATPFLCEEEKYLLDEGLANQLSKIKSLTVKEYKLEDKNINPPKPFITTTLQREASNKLGYTSKKTMELAQFLFEKSYITYHRTDNVNLSEDGATLARETLMSKGLAVPEDPNKWKNKADAQLAHPAITPVSFDCEHGEGLKDEHIKLLELIRKRTLACQMIPGIDATQKLILESTEQFDGKSAEFVANGKQIKSLGWREIDSDSTLSEDNESDETVELTFPEYSPGDLLDVQKGEVDKLKTEPKPYFTESTLIAELERREIGRPSTMANIISTILARDYVDVNGKKFIATELGKVAYRYLNEEFSFMNISYTRDMESKLDKIAQGKASYIDVVTECYKDLQNNLGKLNERDDLQVEKFECSECGDGVLSQKTGKYGKFWGCSNYTNGCKAIYNDEKGKPVEKKPAQQKEKKYLDISCPECKEKIETFYSVKKKKTYFKCEGCDQFFNENQKGGGYTYNKDGEWKECS